MLRADFGVAAEEDPAGDPFARRGLARVRGVEVSGEQVVDQVPATVIKLRDGQGQKFEAGHVAGQGLLGASRPEDVGGAGEEEQALARPEGGCGGGRSGGDPVRGLLDGGDQVGDLLQLVEDDGVAAKRSDEAVGVVRGRRLGGRVVEGEVAHAQFGGDGAGQSGLAGLPGAGQVDDPELAQHVANEGVEVSGVHGVIGGVRSSCSEEDRCLTTRNM